MSAQNQLVQIHTNLDQLLKSKQKALPKNFNQTRFLQNCITVLQDTKDIEKMEPKSIARTMLKGAFLGLDFFMRECYAIPYGKFLNFQTDYKGEIKVCKNFSLKPIRDMYAKVVREGDKFEVKIINNNPIINFFPLPFNNKQIVGAFAVCLYEDGTVIYEEMTSEDIEHIRNTFSKQPNGLMWKETPSEAYKKTVIRRLRKWIPIDFNEEQQEAFDEGGDAKFDDITDLEPIQMPKAIEEKKTEPDPLQPNVLPPDEEPAEESMPEPEEELSPPVKSVKDVVGNGGGMFGDLEGQQIIVGLRSYCKVKGMSLDQISRFHLKKPVEKLTPEEIKKLEAVTKEEGKKIK